MIGSTFEWHSTDRRREPYLRLRLQPDYVIEDRWDQEIQARDVIEKIAQQGGSRIPKNKEAQSMARLKMMAWGIARKYAKPSMSSHNQFDAGNVRASPKLGVKHQTHFKIITTRNHGTCTARLYTKDQGKLIVEGTGEAHYKAMVELREKVGSRAARREREEMRAEEASNLPQYQDLFPSKS